MRISRSLIALALVAQICSQSSQAQVACGNHVITGTSSAAASVTSTAVDMSAAKVLYMSCDWDSVGVTITPSDSGGNTWISLGGPTTDGSSALRAQHWYAKNPTVSASQTFTCTVSSGTANMDVAAQGITGADTTAPLDANPANATGNTATPTPGAVTTTSANEVILAFGASVNSHTWAAGTGYTLEAHNNFHAQQCKAVTTTQTGASTAFGGLGATDHWIAGSATFKQASGGGSNSANLSDTSTSSPAVVASAGRSASMSGSVTSADTITTASGKGATLSDSSASSPAISIGVNAAWSQPNSVTSADAVAVQAGKGAVLADSSTSAPSVATQSGKGAVLADNSTSAPAVLAEAAHGAAIGDASQSAPAIAVSAGRSASLSDASASAPSLQVQSGKGALIAESNTSAPSVQVHAVHNVQIAEASTSRDALSVQVHRGGQQRRRVIIIGG